MESKCGVRILELQPLGELREETGVNSADIVAEAPFWLTYDFPPEVREKLSLQWGSDWKGQAQKWFLFKFTGKDEEVNLSGDGTEKPEFGRWSWISPQEIVEFGRWSWISPQEIVDRVNFLSRPRPWMIHISGSGADEHIELVNPISDRGS